MTLLTEIERIDIERRLSNLTYMLSQQNPPVIYQRLINEHRVLREKYYLGLQELINKYEIKQGERNES